MSLLTDLLGGGGGGSSGGAGFYRWYQSWLQNQAAEQKLSDERVAEQGKTQADVRRNEIADRSGYSGLVTTGPGVMRSDATVAAQMALLDPTDPQRQTYETQLADEAAKQAQAKRIITGEQYAAEDAFKKLGNQISSAADSTALDALQKQYDDLKTKYDWWDFTGTGDYAAQIGKRRKALEASAGSGVNSSPTSSEGGS